ncbi:Anti-sigma regulatory factor (Ser/Thr protein kinase) [Paractinoplanes atraurantiacus]|uniref:Anti-sigma regulatory factor (Ser/Thr protein kinase) n=1 Tax=Paractinoplanes atraurantiacus TaxID=1036182 RepID=A0A285F3C5_9ACTN|nr:Anti-sigma regulatory factor (Ser/Thr protein kinase) [Actinoplanes atraurantiacus]
MHVESDHDASVALVTVAGPWDRALWQRSSTRLQKCLAEHPEAIIVDLSGLDDPGARSAPTWINARLTAAAMEPPVQLALCVPPDLPLADRLQRLGARNHLPVYAKVRQARVSIAGRLPLTERLSLTLRPDPEAPSLARNLVSDACLAWNLPELLHPSRTVMSELVTNAVEHARTEMTVVVSLRGPGLHMIVSDLCPEPPRLIKPSRVLRGRPLDDRGLGLRVVDGTATAWGTLPTSTGKVVWATLQPRRPGSRVTGLR